MCACGMHVSVCVSRAPIQCDACPGRVRPGPDGAVGPRGTPVGQLKASLPVVRRVPPEPPHHGPPGGVWPARERRHHQGQPGDQPAVPGGAADPAQAVGGEWQISSGDRGATPVPRRASLSGRGAQMAGDGRAGGGAEAGGSAAPGAGGRPTEGHRLWRSCCEPSDAGREGRRGSPNPSSSRVPVGVRGYARTAPTLHLRES